MTPDAAMASRRQQVALLGRCSALDGAAEQRKSHLLCQQAPQEHRHLASRQQVAVATDAAVAADGRQAERHVIGVGATSRLHLNGGHEARRSQ